MIIIIFYISINPYLTLKVKRINLYQTIINKIVNTVFNILLYYMMIYQQL